MTALPMVRLPGRHRFDAIATLQGRLVAARQAEQIGDVALLLEHEPVITLGRRARKDFLLAPPELLAKQGIGFETADRGGDVTWHGPGQYVFYPILKLDPVRAPRGHLARLEELAVRTAQACGVEAFRRDGKAGAWTDAGKLAAIGFRIRRGVTYHGLSFNVCPDLSGFELIVPCGLTGEVVTSLAAILGAACPSMDEVATRFAEAAAPVFEREVSLLEPGSTRLPAPLAALLPGA